MVKIKFMKIVLIRPKTPSRFALTFPLSLGYLASAVRSSGHQVILEDAALFASSPKESFAKYQNEDVDVFGIQVLSGMHHWAREFVEMVRAEMPKSQVVIGGPHITCLNELALEHIGADFAIMGEGEYVFPQLLEIIKHGKADSFKRVPGLIYRDGNSLKRSDISYSLIEDIDDLPFPAWDLSPPQRYEKFCSGATQSLKGKRLAPILTSRGCPYQCTFCSSPFLSGRKIRFRSPDEIVREVRCLVDDFGVDEIAFSDDNFTMLIERAEEICDKLIAAQLNIPWRLPNGVRVDRLSDALIEKMARSGCYGVGLGVETGDPEMVKLVNKKLDLNKVRSVVQRFRDYQIQTSGFFIVGFPDDTVETIERTIDFALSCDFDRVQVSVFTPYPGSVLFEQVFRGADGKQDNDLVKSYLNERSIPRINPHLDNSEIHILQKKFIKKYYFRPKVIWSFIRNFRFSQMIAVTRHPLVSRWFRRDQSVWTGDVN